MALPQLIEQAAACQHKLLRRQCQLLQPQQHASGTWTTQPHSDVQPLQHGTSPYVTNERRYWLCR